MPVAGRRNQPNSAHYKELQRTAIRDNAALTEMESELFPSNPEGSRTSALGIDLNSNCSRQAGGPPQRRIVAIGLLSGLVIGSAAALVRDRRSGLVFSQDELGCCHVR